MVVELSPTCPTRVCQESVAFKLPPQFEAPYSGSATLEQSSPPKPPGQRHVEQLAGFWYPLFWHVRVLLQAEEQV